MTINKAYLETVYILGKKELASYFNSPIAYIFIGAFLLVGNWLFFTNFYLINEASMRQYFSFLPWMFMFLAPAITMRLWAEEKKSGTIEFLLTLPITNFQAVLAKFLSSLAFIAIGLLLTLTLPISVAQIGHLDWGPVIGSYLGALLLAGAYLALGLFISALTKNQIISFVLALFASFGFYIIGSDFVVASAPQLFVPIFSFLGLGSHFQTIAKGVIDTKDLFYYLSFILFFLWLNHRVIEQRNWQ
ncbi:MAG: ABC transporter permease subunit [Candidatus Falkowbacteria bacterium]